jgi:hypothetical protein
MDNQETTALLAMLALKVLLVQTELVLQQVKVVVQVKQETTVLLVMLALKVLLVQTELVLHRDKQVLLV